MKKQIIAGIVLATLATTGAYTYASNTSTGSVTKTEIMDLVKKVRDGVTLTTEEQAKLDAVKLNRGQKHEKIGSGSTMSGSMNEMRGEMGMGGMMGAGFSTMTQLSDAEKTALTTMTADQKKAFFDAKMTDVKAKAEAKETVIDKLLAGTALTADEETLRQEIIKDRAAMKAQKTAMDANMQAGKGRMGGQKGEKRGMNR
ncbi:MAG: hypothetical protein PHG82_04265 [Candidatus Gracilibacteria bacterium]|nr:hypothetical protein [Candidatus Gracilibacteria bacterium]